MLLSRYGLREWGIATAVAALLCIGVFVWSLPPALYAVVGVLWLGVVAFFRDPLGRRPASSDPADMVSPADGTVSAALKTRGVLRHVACVWICNVALLAMSRTCERRCLIKAQFGTQSMQS